MQPKAQQNIHLSKFQSHFIAQRANTFFTFRSSCVQQNLFYCFLSTFFVSSGSVSFFEKRHCFPFSSVFDFCFVFSSFLFPCLDCETSFSFCLSKSFIHLPPPPFIPFTAITRNNCISPLLPFPDRRRPEP